MKVCLVFGVFSIFNMFKRKEMSCRIFLSGGTISFITKRIGEKGNWANRLRVGFATNDESPFAPFSVDNNINIRGVGNVIDRGTGVIVLNTEYRQILYKKNNITIQGNAFIDAGTWRNSWR